MLANRAPRHETTSRSRCIRTRLTCAALIVQDWPDALSVHGCCLFHHLGGPSVLTRPSGACAREPLVLTTLSSGDVVQSQRLASPRSLELDERTHGGIMTATFAAR
jgi:hypothetical protein